MNAPADASSVGRSSTQVVNRPISEPVVIANLCGFDSEPTEEYMASVRASSMVSSFSLWRSTMSFIYTFFDLRYDDDDDNDDYSLRTERIKPVN